MSPGEELEALLAEYRAGLPEKLARIEALHSRGQLAELARELHTLAGSAGTFGLPRVSAAARAAEDQVSSERLPELIAALREACSSIAGP